MELCIRPTAGRRKTNNAGRPDILADGLGGISSIFLYSNGDGLRYNHGVHRAARRNTTTTQVREIHHRQCGLRAAAGQGHGKVWVCAHGGGYVDDFMSLVIPVLQDQSRHVATAVMTGIHDVFPPNGDNSNDPILEKKLLKEEGRYSTQKTLLGFDFDGTTKMMWLEAAKRETLLTILKG
jgi:hypothetical protein